MPLPIPLTNLTAQYQRFGGASIYTTGYFTIVGGNCDMVIEYGSRTGETKSLASPNIGPGQYTFIEPQKNGILAISLRAANGNVTTPAQTVQGQLFEPTTPAFIPVASNSVTNNVSATMTQLAQQTLAAPAASVLFTNIPQDFTSLKLIARMQSDQAADVSLLFQLDGDVAANYNIQRLFGSGAAATASQSLAQTAGQAGVVGTHVGGGLSEVEMLIPSYTLAGEQLVQSSFASFGTNYYTGQDFTLWFGVSAVTAIQLFPSAGNFSGGVFTLYGL